MVARVKMEAGRAGDEARSEALPFAPHGSEDRLERAADIILSALACGPGVSMDRLVEELRRARVSPSSLRSLAPALTVRIERVLSSEGGSGRDCVSGGDGWKLDAALECLLAKLAVALGIGARAQRDRGSRPFWARSRTAFASAGLVLLLGGLPSQGLASTGDNPFAGLSTVSDHQLAGSRGGFMVEGVDVNFGAIVKTVVNGAVVLETQLTATNGGLVAVQSGPATTSSTPVPGSPQISVKVVDNTLVAEGTLVPGQNAPGVYTSGVVITSPGGSSAAVSTFDPSRIVNAVSSNDSNQNITQQMEINVTLSNYSALRSQIQLSQLGTNVTNNVQSALATSISH
ncbi:MAG: hypothetical protein KGO02_16060 [Alphaproteobacteria bacterium]|nr:hypothetical protein [Alphaproteobacteria bacterium]